jgi:hypothetical protein
MRADRQWRTRKQKKGMGATSAQPELTGFSLLIAPIRAEA